MPYGPDLARVEEEGARFCFPGPLTSLHSLRYLLGATVVMALLVMPLGLAAIVPLGGMLLMLMVGVLAELFHTRGWVLEDGTLRRQIWGERHRVERIVLDGGPGERLVLRADQKLLCTSAPERGGLERIEHVGRRIAERAGVPFDDRRPSTHWQRWSAGDRGLAALRWRYEQANERFGLIPGAEEPANVRWEHDRCATSISGQPIELAGDEVRIGDVRFPVAAFRQAAVVREWENGSPMARIHFVRGDHVEHTPSFSARTPSGAARVRWLLERIQERIVDRGSAAEVPDGLRAMRASKQGQ